MSAIYLRQCLWTTSDHTASSWTQSKFSCGIQRGGVKSQGVKRRTALDKNKPRALSAAAGAFTTVWVLGSAEMYCVWCCNRTGSSQLIWRMKIANLWPKYIYVCACVLKFIFKRVNLRFSPTFLSLCTFVAWACRSKRQKLKRTHR